MEKLYYGFNDINIVEHIMLSLLHVKLEVDSMKIWATFPPKDVPPYGIKMFISFLCGKFIAYTFGFELKWLH
jgi:hypothetical protein